jgi:hypothetical protein
MSLQGRLCAFAESRIPANSRSWLLRFNSTIDRNFLQLKGKQKPAEAGSV